MTAWLLPLAVGFATGILSAWGVGGGTLLLLCMTLLLGVDAGASAYFGAHWLLGAGMCTMAVAALGMLGSQRITHLAGWAAVLSSAMTAEALRLV